MAYFVFLCEHHQEFDVLKRRYTKQHFILMYKGSQARKRGFQNNCKNLWWFVDVHGGKQY